MNASPREINVYTTDRKVYAEGARVDELPLPRADCALVDSGLVTVRTPPLRRPRRRMFRRLNECAVPGYAPICLDSNDPNTVNYAFRQRLLRDVPAPDPSCIKRLQKFVHDFLVANVRPVRKLEFEEWLASTSYSEVRKDELRTVEASLRGAIPTARQASHIDTFVKSEFYPCFKHARLINSRSDVFKVWSGPRFKAIEDELYKMKFFIKHVPVPDRPGLISAMKRAHRHYYATDFTAFESHFTPQILEAVECQLYRWCLAGDANVDFLCRTLKGPNRMRTRTAVSATVQGRRMSGDMCTSLGNGFTNLMLALFLVSEKGGSLEGFVEGDDGIFATSVELNSADYAKLGFTIKIEEVADPCTASFCGLIFAPSGQIIRDPFRFMMGFGWTSSFINAGPRIMGELLRAKALSTVYETPNCPIVGALARHALRRTRGYSPRFVDDGYHRVPRDERGCADFAVTLDTRQLFERLFGISVATQLLAESLIMKGDMAGLSSLIPAPSDVLLYSSRYVTAA